MRRRLLTIFVFVVFAFGGLIALTEGQESATTSEQPLDLLGLVDSEALLTSFPHELETFEYGAPIAHFLNGPSINLTESGEIERIEVPRDGWSCRMVRFIETLAFSAACPERVTDAQAHTLEQAEAFMASIYSEFVDGAGASTEGQSIERRIELYANGLATESRLAGACHVLGVATFDEAGTFTTSAGVDALVADPLRPIILVVPSQIDQFFRDG